MKRHLGRALTSDFIKAISIGLLLTAICFLPVVAQDSDKSAAASPVGYAASEKSASLSLEDDADEGKILLSVDSPDYKVIADRYLDYHQALLKAKSLKELVPYRMRVFQDQYNQTMAPGKFKGADNPDSLLPLIQIMEPRKIKITKILIKDDWAQLHAEGLDAGELIDGMNQGLNKIGQELSKALGNASQSGQEKTVTLGSTQLHKENGIWQIGKERWSSKTFTQPSTESIKN